MAAKAGKKYCLLRPSSLKPGPFPDWSLVIEFVLLYTPRVAVVVRWRPVVYLWREVTGRGSALEAPGVSG